MFKLLKTLPRDILPSTYAGGTYPRNSFGIRDVSKR